MTGALTVVYSDGINFYQNTRQVTKATLSNVFSDYFDEVNLVLLKENFENVNYEELLPHRGGRRWKFSDLFNLDWESTVKFEGRETDENGNKIVFSKAFTSFRCTNLSCVDCDFAILYRNENNPDNVWISHPPSKNALKRTPIHRLQIERFETHFNKYYK